MCKNEPNEGTITVAAAAHFYLPPNGIRGAPDECTCIERHIPSFFCHTRVSSH